MNYMGRLPLSQEVSLIWARKFRPWDVILAVLPAVFAIKKACTGGRGAAIVRQLHFCPFF